MKENPYLKLTKFILTGEKTEFINLVDVALDKYDDKQRLHLYHDEKNIKLEIQPMPRQTLSLKSLKKNGQNGSGGQGNTS